MDDTEVVMGGVRSHRQKKKKNPRRVKVAAAYEEEGRGNTTPEQIRRLDARRLPPLEHDPAKKLSWEGALLSGRHDEDAQPGLPNASMMSSRKAARVWDQPKAAQVLGTDSCRGGVVPATGKTLRAGSFKNPFEDATQFESLDAHLRKTKKRFCIFALVGALLFAAVLIAITATQGGKEVVAPTSMTISTGGGRTDLKITPMESVFNLRLVLDADLNQVSSDSTQKGLQRQVASSLNVDETSVEIKNIQAGSVIVDFAIKTKSTLELMTKIENASRKGGFSFEDIMVTQVFYRTAQSTVFQEIEMNISPPSPAPTIDAAQIETTCLCQHGTCKDNSFGQSECRCFQGWEGALCDHDISYCARASAWESCNHGACVEGNSSFTCTCHKGWSGSFCGLDDDECASSPCSVGHCVNLPGSYRCECPVGVTGTNCDQSADFCSIFKPCASDEACINLKTDFQCGQELLKAELGNNLATSTSAGGLWSDPSTWQSGAVPLPNATVYVVGNVQIDRATTQIKSLWVGSSGSINTQLDSCYLVIAEVLQIDGVFSSTLSNEILVVATDIEVSASGQLQTTQITLVGSLQVAGGWSVDRLRLLGLDMRTLEFDISCDLELLADVNITTTGFRITGNFISNGYTMSLSENETFTLRTKKIEHPISLTRGFLALGDPGAPTEVLINTIVAAFIVVESTTLLTFGESVQSLFINGDVVNLGTWQGPDLVLSIQGHVVNQPTGIFNVSYITVDGDAVNQEGGIWKARETVLLGKDDVQRKVGGFFDSVFTSEVSSLLVVLSSGLSFSGELLCTKQLTIEFPLTSIVTRTIRFMASRHRQDLDLIVKGYGTVEYSNGQNVEVFSNLKIEAQTVKLVDSNLTSTATDGKLHFIANLIIQTGTQVSTGFIEVDGGLTCDGRLTATTFSSGGTISIPATAQWDVTTVRLKGNTVGPRVIAGVLGGALVELAGDVMFDQSVQISAPILAARYSFTLPSDKQLRLVGMAQPNSLAVKAGKLVIASTSSEGLVLGNNINLAAPEVLIEPNQILRTRAGGSSLAIEGNLVNQGTFSSRNDEGKSSMQLVVTGTVTNSNGAVFNHGTVTAAGIVNVAGGVFITDATVLQSSSSIPTPFLSGITKSSITIVNSQSVRFTGAELQGSLRSTSSPLLVELADEADELRFTGSSLISSLHLQLDRGTVAFATDGDVAVHSSLTIEAPTITFAPTTRIISKQPLGAKTIFVGDVYNFGKFLQNQDNVEHEFILQVDGSLWSIGVVQAMQVVATGNLTNANTTAGSWTCWQTVLLGKQPRGISGNFESELVVEAEGFSLAGNTTIGQQLTALETYRAADLSDFTVDLSGHQLRLESTRVLSPLRVKLEGGGSFVLDARAVVGLFDDVFLDCSAATCSVAAGTILLGVGGARVFAVEGDLTNYGTFAGVEDLDSGRGAVSASSAEALLLKVSGTLYNYGVLQNDEVQLTQAKIVNIFPGKWTPRKTVISGEVDTTTVEVSGGILGGEIELSEVSRIIVNSDRLTFSGSVLQQMKGEITFEFVAGEASSNQLIFQSSRQSDELHLKVVNGVLVYDVQGTLGLYSDVNVTAPQVVISKGTTVISFNGDNKLTVHGDLTNNGRISTYKTIYPLAYSVGTDSLLLDVFGSISNEREGVMENTWVTVRNNVTNDGTWNASTTEFNVKSSDTIFIQGDEVISSRLVEFATDVSIVGDASFSSSINTFDHVITMGANNTLTLAGNSIESSIQVVGGKLALTKKGAIFIQNFVSSIEAQELLVSNHTEVLPLSPAQTLLLVGDLINRGEIKFSEAFNLDVVGSIYNYGHINMAQLSCTEDVFNFKGGIWKSDKLTIKNSAFSVGERLLGGTFESSVAVVPSSLVVVDNAIIYGELDSQHADGLNLRFTSQPTNATAVPTRPFIQLSFNAQRSSLTLTARGGDIHLTNDQEVMGIHSSVQLTGIVKVTLGTIVVARQGNQVLRVKGKLENSGRLTDWKVIEPAKVAASVSELLQVTVVGDALNTATGRIDCTGFSVSHDISNLGYWGAAKTTLIADETQFARQITGNALYGFVSFESLVVLTASASFAGPVAASRPISFIPRNFGLEMILLGSELVTSLQLDGGNIRFAGPVTFLTMDGTSLVASKVIVDESSRVQLFGVSTVTINATLQVEGSLEASLDEKIRLVVNGDVLNYNRLSIPTISVSGSITNTAGGQWTAYETVLSGLLADYHSMQGMFNSSIVVTSLQLDALGGSIVFDGSLSTNGQPLALSFSQSSDTLTFAGSRTHGPLDLTSANQLRIACGGQFALYNDMSIHGPVVVAPACTLVSYGTPHTLHVTGPLRIEGRLSKSLNSLESLTLVAGGTVTNMGTVDCTVAVLQGDLHNLGEWPATIHLNGTQPRLVTGTPVAGRVFLLSEVAFANHTDFEGALVTQGFNIIMEDEALLTLGSRYQTDSLAVVGGRGVRFRFHGSINIDTDVTVQAPEIILSPLTRVLPTNGFHLLTFAGDLHNEGFLQTGFDHGLSVAVHGSVLNTGYIVCDRISVHGSIDNRGEWQALTELDGPPGSGASPAPRSIAGEAITGDVHLRTNISLVGDAHVAGSLDSLGHIITMQQNRTLTVSGNVVADGLTLKGGADLHYDAVGQVILAASLQLKARTVVLGAETSLVAYNGAKTLAVLGDLRVLGDVPLDISFTVQVHGGVENRGRLSPGNMHVMGSIVNDGVWTATTTLTSNASRSVAGTSPIVGPVVLASSMTFTGNATFAGTFNAAGHALTLPTGAYLQLMGSSHDTDLRVLGGAVEFGCKGVVRLGQDFTVAAPLVRIGHPTHLVPVGASPRSIAFDTQRLLVHGILQDGENAFSSGVTRAEAPLLHVAVSGEVENMGTVVNSNMTIGGSIRNEGAWASKTYLQGVAVRSITGGQLLLEEVTLLSPVAFAGPCRLASNLNTNGHVIAMEPDQILDLKGNEQRSDVVVTGGGVLRFSREGHAHFSQNLRLSARRVEVSAETLFGPEDGSWLLAIEGDLLNEGKLQVNSRAQMYVEVEGSVENRQVFVANSATVTGDILTSQGRWVATTQLRGAAPRALTGKLEGDVKLLSNITLQGDLTVNSVLFSNGFEIVLPESSVLRLRKPPRDDIKLVAGKLLLDTVSSESEITMLSQALTLDAPSVEVSEATYLTATIPGVVLTLRAADTLNLGSLGMNVETLTESLIVHVEGNLENRNKILAREIEVRGDIFNSGYWVSPTLLTATGGDGATRARSVQGPKEILGDVLIERSMALAGNATFGGRLQTGENSIIMEEGASLVLTGDTFRGDLRVEGATVVFTRHGLVDVAGELNIRAPAVRILESVRMMALSAPQTLKVFGDLENQGQLVESFPLSLLVAGDLKMEARAVISIQECMLMGNVSVAAGAQFAVQKSYLHWTAAVGAPAYQMWIKTDGELLPRTLIVYTNSFLLTDSMTAPGSVSSWRVRQQVSGSDASAVFAEWQDTKRVEF